MVFFRKKISSNEQFFKNDNFAINSKLKRKFDYYSSAGELHNSIISLYVFGNALTYLKKLVFDLKIFFSVNRNSRRLQNLQNY